MIKEISMGGPVGGPFYVRNGKRFERYEGHLTPTFPSEGLWVVRHDSRRMVNATELEWRGDVPGLGHMWLREKKALRALREGRRACSSDHELLRALIQALAGPPDAEDEPCF